MPTPATTRRTLLKMSPLAVAAMAATTASAATPAVDLSKPADNLRVLMKILASTDPGEVVLSYGSGRVYACLSGRAPVPLFGTHSASVARAKAAPDGSFVLRQHIIGFRTAVDQEEMIDTMVNPVTGQTITLPPTDYGVGDTDYRLDGTFSLAATTPPRQLNRAGPRPWSVADGIVSMSDDSVSPIPGPGQPKIDVVTRSAMASDVLDPAIKSPNSWFSFTAVDPFRPWLKMTEPGFQLWHLTGRKVTSPEALPAFIRQTVAKRFPRLFELPSFDT